MTYDALTEDQRILFHCIREDVEIFGRDRHELLREDDAPDADKAAVAAVWAGER